MNKIFLALIFLFSLSLLVTPAHGAQAFMSLTDNIDACLASGDCTICDVLTVLFNFAKFIYITMAGLVLFFVLWQSILIIMNFGNAETVKAATDKIKNTLLAALIILASYTLVGALITVYSGGNFKTFIKGQTSTNWAVGPICERSTRPENQVVNNGTQSLVSDGGCGADVNIVCGCEDDGENKCDCGGIQRNNGQCADASLSLETLLGCIKKEVAKQAPSISLRISSISDDHGLARCRSAYTRQCAKGESASADCCYHQQNSCHYGGGFNKDGSYAADFGLENLPMFKDLFTSIVETQCNGKLFPEGDHYHVSANGCRGVY